MSVYEVLTVTLIVVLASATVIALYVGMMNWFRAAYVVRCAACHHLTVSSANEPQQSCPHCRHPVLLHPVHAVHHPRSVRQLRVVGDRLRY
ncbi:hypothetical protein AB0K11_07670 [Mycobacterium sp. NPDC050551]|jgi:DNA-directed RNA polymerase subunit RPC12/RpoP|uniref:hypothetical protein n=1 Tax=Mycobacterium sp. NPDC050551 TaxID=3155407 RepID=UPI0034371BE2